MPVPVVNIRIMWVRVRQFLVPMRVRVWVTRRIVRSMSVLMMLVVRVPMVVFQRFVPMPVLVPFR